MKDKTEQGFEDDIEQYQQLLELSSQNLKPDIQAHLNEKRRHALDSLGTNSIYNGLIWRPALALTIPVMLVAMIMFYSPTAVISASPHIFSRA